MTLTFFVTLLLFFVGPRSDRGTVYIMVHNGQALRRETLACIKSLQYSTLMRFFWNYTKTKTTNKENILQSLVFSDPTGLLEVMAEWTPYQQVTEDHRLRPFSTKHVPFLFFPPFFFLWDLGLMDNQKDEK